MYLYVLDLTLDLNSEISNIYCSLDPCDHSADGIIDTHPRHVLDYADHVVLGGSSTYTPIVGAQQSRHPRWQAQANGARLEPSCEYSHDCHPLRLPTYNIYIASAGMSRR